RADESYWAVLVVGGVSAGAAAGGDGAARAGARERVRWGAAGTAGTVTAGAGAGRAFSRSAGSRLAVVTLPGGPTGGASVEPTVTLSASGLPALSSGAVAVVGTV